MQAIKIQSNSRCHRRGSAMVLVIVVTVLLAAIGAMFILTARIDQTTSAVIVDNRNLTSGVNTVVNKIQNVLTEDLLGTGPTEMQRLLATAVPKGQRPIYDIIPPVNEPWDSPYKEYWLSSIEPKLVNGQLRWTPITDLWDNNFGLPGSSGLWFDPNDRSDVTQWDGSPWFGDTYFFRVVRSVYPKVINDQSSMDVIAFRGTWDNPNEVRDYGASADADGDGVADSRWVRIPGQQTADGEQMYAAVRIIDNNAMLNLNTAHTISAADNGKYLSEVDFSKFLRGYDVGHADRLLIARKKQYSLVQPDIDTVEDYHNNVIMHMESPVGPYILFDIGDELEIRNRFMLTSNAIARFEQSELIGELPDGLYPDYHGIGYYTFDYGRGNYDSGGAFWSTKSKRIPIADSVDFNIWKDKLNHTFFDDSAPAGYEYMYDRRHVCTFYSFDRNIRRRDYPFVNPTATAPDPTEDRTKVDTTILATAPRVFMPLSGGIDIRDDITSNTRQSRRNILHLLYAFRAYFIAEHGDDYKQAARRSAQVVANMIDYLDYEDPAGSQGPFFDPDYGDQTNDNPTFINRAVVIQLILEISGFYFPGSAIEIDKTGAWPDTGSLITMNQFDFGLGVDDPAEVVYGFERQPFISELYAVSDGANITQFAVELVNPYILPGGDIDLEDWRIKIGDIVLYPAFLPGTKIDAAVAGALGRLVVRSDSTIDAASATVEVTNMGLSMSRGDVLELQRPDPANAGKYITVDRTDPSQITGILNAADAAKPASGAFSSKRDDTEWGFTNNKAFAALDSSPNLGLDNNVTLTNTTLEGFQMPVANNDAAWGTLGDLERVLFVGNDYYSTDPNAVVETVTEKVAAASNESDVRYDIKANPELLEYISLINGDNGRIPGRINVNTATMEVLRAAIPPSKDGLWDPNDLAAEIVNYRQVAPFEKIGDLLNLNTFTQFETDPNDIGDVSIAGDIEDRHWLLSLVANKFTVRSDVFTAYILVRIGIDGPQRRMIAILDRSEVYLPGDKPRVIALHPVPDPR